MKSKTIYLNQKGCHISSIINIKDSSKIHFDINGFFEKSDLEESFLAILAENYERANACEINTITFKISDVYDWGLKFDERPDYVLCKNLFKNLFIKSGFEMDYEYDWIINSVINIFDIFNYLFLEKRKK